MSTRVLLTARLRGRRANVCNWRGLVGFSTVETLPSSGCSWMWGDSVGLGNAANATPGTKETVGHGGHHSSCKPRGTGSSLPRHRRALSQAESCPPNARGQALTPHRGVCLDLGVGL